MIRGLFSAGSGLIAHQTALDVTANNLANVNTDGFKRARTEFQDLLYTGPDARQVGSGTRVSAISTIFTQGPPVVTDRELDVFIDGLGFFRILLPDGQIGFTRDGGFLLNAEGQLITADGFFLDPPITLPPDTLSVTITPDGAVLARTAESPVIPIEVGQIQLARFINPGGLARTGRNLFVETAGSGPPIVGTPGDGAFGLVEQGVLERSNVDLTGELVRLITAQRAFEFNARAFTTANEMMQTATDLVSPFR